MTSDGDNLWQSRQRAHGVTPGGQSAVTIEFCLFGQPLRLSTTASDQPMRLAEIVPLAWTVCDHIVHRTVQFTQARGRMPSCHRGCDACCRYAVPLSVPEAMRLGQDVAALPAGPRARIEKLFHQAVARIVQAGPPAIPAGPADACGPGRADNAKALHAMAQWYSSLDMPCPLLVQRCCDFYSCRPTACREHLAASQSALCAGNNPATGELVPMPVSVTHALSLLAAEMEGPPVEAILMPAALAWCRDNAARTNAAWPGRVLLERFAAILQHLAGQAEQKRRDAAAA